MPVSADVKVFSIEGSKRYGCFHQSPSSLLINISRRKIGSIFNYTKEIKKVSKQVRSLSSQISSLKGLDDKKSKALLKRLKKKKTALKLVKKGIIKCRDGTFSQALNSNCTNSNGTGCDDGNPCTTDDKCQNEKCVGVPVSASSIKCSFDSCEKSVGQCVNAKFIVCFNGAAGEEVCNSIDDDCNGRVDENSVCLPSPTPTRAAPTVIPTKGPTKTPKATPTITNTPTITPTPAPTLTPTPGPTPFTCIAPSAPGGNGNINPDGCPCVQAGNCAGICSCGIPCNVISNPCPAGTTCNSDGTCSGVCKPSVFNVCSEGGGVTPICIPGDEGNRSAAGCPCTIDGNCENECVNGFCN